MDNTRLFGRDAHSADRVSHVSYTTLRTSSIDTLGCQMYAKEAYQRLCVIGRYRVHEPLLHPRGSSSV